MKFNSNEVESNYRNNHNKDNKIAGIDIHTKHRLEMESRIVVQNNQKIPELSIGELSNIDCLLAFAVFFLNLILPGVGTMVAGCKVSGFIGKTFICLGYLQLITFPCLIGWIWAQVTSVGLFKAACNRKGLKDFDKAAHEIEEKIKTLNDAEKGLNQIEIAEEIKIKPAKDNNDD